MLAGFLIGVISSGIWIHKCTGAPTVTLTASSSPYIDIGGSMTLTCSINEDVQITSAYLRKNGIYYVWIRPSTSSGCTFTKLNGGDQHVYNGSCEQNMKTIHIIINSTNVSDDNATWACSMAYQSCGSPGGACVSIANVTTALRVLVSSVQLTDQTGQPLVTQVSVLDGSNKDFRCDTSPNGSRPRALFKWYKRSENQSPVLIHDQSISTPGPSPEFDFSISISYSTLTLMGSRSYHNMCIYCEAQDETNRGNVTRSREVLLNIVYGPGNSIYLTPNDSVFQVEEGKKTPVIVCRATCNPECSYTWFKDTLLINNSSTLSLGTAFKNMTGNYTCESFNSIGGQRRGLGVIVLYGAQITNLSVAEGNTVAENATVTLRCLVDSNPKSNITWTKQGILGNLQTNYYVHESQLIIKHAQCLDTLNYTCNANNGLGSSVERNVPLYVTCHPRTDFRSPLVTKVYSKRYGNASLIYTVIAFPEPIFNWSFIGNGSDSKHLPDSANKHDTGLQSILIFTNLSINDFGFYRVIANNSFPTSATEVFHLIPADVPDMPSNVTVTDIKQTSLTVNWVAGFNGGLQQTFQINITANKIPRSLYAPDPGYRKSGTKTIDNLMAYTEYSISISANNSMGSSSVTNNTKAITLPVPKPLPISAIAGGVTGGIAAVVLLVIMIFIWRRYQNKKSREGEIYENATHHDTSSNEENGYESLSKSSCDNTYACIGTSNETLVGNDKLYINLMMDSLSNKKAC